MAGNDQSEVVNLASIIQGSKGIQPRFRPWSRNGGQFDELRRGFHSWQRHAAAWLPTSIQRHMLQSMRIMPIRQASADQESAEEFTIMQKGLQGSDEWTQHEGSNSIVGSEGYPTVLLIGFTKDEFDLWKKLALDYFKADLMNVVPGTESMMEDTLREAMEAVDTEFEEMNPGREKVFFLSGMFPYEISCLLEEYRKSKLPNAIVGLAMRKNYDEKELEILVEELIQNMDGFRTDQLVLVEDAK